MELKKYVIDTSIFKIIISKFCYEKKLYLIILIEVDKNLEIGFYYTILPFNLAIYLQVKGNGKSLFDAKKILY